MKRVPLNRKDFTAMTMYMGCEGGEVYTAEQDGMFYVITDEGSMECFLSEENAKELADYLQPNGLVFDSAQERDSYLMKRYGPSEEMQRYNSENLRQLESLGFRKIGEWLLEKGELNYRVSHHYESANILYAFTYQGEPVYLGKTNQPLEKHLWDFIYKGTKQGELIREALSDRNPVEIYALPDNGLLYFGGFQINLADGLFDSMISELSPAWS
ncbi:MAG: hypothetical protein ACXWT0_04430 [Methylobacter sp.]